MIKLSVNINKIATLRNARGGNNPNVLAVALDCERYGANGITVHPRPDERHIKKQDVYDLAKNITTEFNIEGYPTEDFITMVLEVKPAQVTLVPDAPDAITSNAGWNTIKNFDFLQNLISKFKAANIRTSIFIEPHAKMIEAAAQIQTNRIELYTEPYASQYANNRNNAVKPFAEAAKVAHKLGLEVNAGHDLSLENLGFFAQQVPHLKEVSIGHALVCDALYLGLENTINLYKNQLQTEK